MLIDQERLEMGRAEVYCTLYAREAFRVRRGSVRVYVVEHSQQGMANRGGSLCLAEAGWVIPAFAFAAADGEMWCLALEAGEGGAELTREPLEAEQYECFLREAGVPGEPGEAPEMRLMRARAVPTEDVITIEDASALEADDPDVSYCVEAGTVYVFLLPVTAEGMRERKEFLCSVTPEDGFAIPGLRYAALGRHWQLSLETKRGTARLRRMGCTRVAREKFLGAAQAQAGGGQAQALADAYAHEGFEESLVQYYTGKTDLADSIREHRQRGHREALRRQLQETIRSGMGEASSAGAAESPLLRTLKHLCQRGGFPLDEQSLARCTPDMPLPEMAAACGLILREVELEGDWYRRDCGLLLGKLDGRPVACVPGWCGGYRLYDAAADRETRLGAQTAKRLSPRAYAVGRSLPAGSLGFRALARFALGGIRRGALLCTVLPALLCLPACLLLPLLVRLAFDRYIPLGQADRLAQVCLAGGVCMLSHALFTLLQRLCGLSLCAHVGNELSHAILARVFALPERVLARFDSGDLAQRVQGVGSMVTRLAASLLALGAALACVPLYLLQMAHYAGELVPAAVAWAAAYALLRFAVSVPARQAETAAAQKESEAASRLAQLLGGIEKLQMAGAEDHALLASIQPIAGQQRSSLRASRWLGLRKALDTLGDMLPAMLLALLLAGRGTAISTGRLAAFGAAFGALASVLREGVRRVIEYRLLLPRLERLRPLIGTAPEDDAGMALALVEQLEGRITFEHVTFRYPGQDEPVLRDVSFDIRPGEYVGLAGCSGSGKSTIFRLLLGFDSPQAGRILFDGRDIAALDKRSLRRRMGVVLQNESLIAGSIYDNIVVTLAHPSCAAAQAAVERVGLQEEIEAMPMRLDTVVHETFETLSGGQRQRILLARAMAGSPDVLLLDEATSALDSLTQRKIAGSLAQLHATRLVIAHRPGVLEDCDRILVLDGGRIVEEGSYAQLSAGHGLFGRMVRQQLAGDGEEEAER